MLKFFKICLIFLISFNALSSVEVGTGFNSAHSGRVVPSLNIALVSADSVISFYSSGVQNSYYYHSSYSLTYFKSKSVGDVFNFPVSFGVGLGINLSERGFDENASSNVEKDSDFVIGPAIRVHWQMFSLMYLSLETIYGIRDIGSHLALNFQDVTSLSVGVRF